MSKASEYNRRRHANNLLTSEHFRRMATEIGYDSRGRSGPCVADAIDADPADWDLVTRVIYEWQSHADIVDDGMFGPASEARWRALYKPYPQAHPIALAALAVAREELEKGAGEEHENNAGAHLHRYRDWPKGDNVEEPIGSWCAFFVVYCLRKGAQRTNRTLRARLTWHDPRQSRAMPIGSAKRTVRRVRDVGVEVSLDEARSGDVICWYRGDRDGEYGHVALIERADAATLTIIEGNVGRFPAKVQRLTLSRGRARLRNSGLYMIARLT